jgi:hypothetical protein
VTLNVNRFKFETSFRAKGYMQRKSKVHGQCSEKMLHNELRIIPLCTSPFKFDAHIIAYMHWTIGALHTATQVCTVQQAACDATWISIFYTNACKNTHTQISCHAFAHSLLLLHHVIFRAAVRTAIPISYSSENKRVPEL